ncbi:MAG: DNA recombination protein RmuC [Bacteroidota bacterium]
MEIVALIFGIAIGIGIMYFIQRSGKATIADSYDQRIQLLTHELENARAINNEKDKQLYAMNGELAGTKSDYENLKKKLDEQKTEIQELQDRFTLQFKNLANDIFEEKSKKFTEQNKVNIHEVLKPLSEKIKDFEKRVEETYDKEAQQRFSLKEEVKRLAELNQQVSKEASNLTKALKGESKTQGNWGEVILESILEKSGLVKNREYFVQTSYTDDNGRRYQPDVVVSYPGDRSIVIDSKVSLVAYERYSNADAAEEADRALKDHLLSVKSHITQLSSKSYHDLYQLQTLDFVMMFMAVEPAYFLAIQQDPDLWNFAYERRILLISPTNLIAALKMIESMWRQEYQSRNAMEIAKKSGDMYDKFVAFIEDLTAVGNRLNSTTTAYQEAMKKLYEGRGNLVRRAEDLKQLGLKAKKDLPKSLIDRLEE